MKKEIFGYTWKKEMEEIHVILISNASGFTRSELTERDFSDYPTMIFTHDSEMKRKLENLKLLNLFFKPIYKKEEQFKVGDWVITNSNAIKNPNGQVGPDGGSGFVPNKVLQISEINNWNGFFCCFFKNHKNGIFSGNFRKATPKEIELYEFKELNEFHLDFGNGYVKINGFRYSTYDLQSILVVLKIQKFHSLKFGCNGQINVTEDLVNKLLNRIA